MASSLVDRDKKPSRSWLGALGVFAVVATLGWVAGPLGLVAAAVIAAAWWALPPLYTVAVSHVVALPVLPGAVDPTVVAAFEAGLLAVLAGPVVRGSDRLVTLSVLVLCGIVLGLATWVGWHVLYPRWLAGALVVGAVALGLYGLHRYAVVSIELREVTPEP